jgi:hypothetical protein
VKEWPPIDITDAGVELNACKQQALCANNHLVRIFTDRSTKQESQSNQRHSSIQCDSSQQIAIKCQNRFDHIQYQSHCTKNLVRKTRARACIKWLPT